MLREAPPSQAAAIRQAVSGKRERGQRGGMFAKERAQWKAGELRGSGPNNDPPSHATWVAPRLCGTSGHSSAREESARQADIVAEQEGRERPPYPVRRQGDGSWPQAMPTLKFSRN